MNDRVSSVNSILKTPPVEISQKEWNELYSVLIQEKKKTKEKIDVASFLIERKFSTNIRKLEFKKSDLSELVFRNMTFKDCDFTGKDFRRTSFQGICSDSCQFDQTKWIQALIQNCSFLNCSFNKSEIIRSQVNATSIVDSNLSFSCWNDSNLQQLSILRGTLYEASFLNAVVHNSVIADSDLIDCLFLNAQDHFSIKGGSPHVITRPIIGFSWDFLARWTYAPVIDEALSESGGIPLKMEMEPPGIDVELLDREVREGIAMISADFQKEMLSIPEELFKRSPPGTEIGKIYRKAGLNLSFCSGLALPGGIDIEPEFYGAIKESATDKSRDYRRSMIEFALLSHARKNQIPVMGTCRGAQLINVYSGGMLNQHVKGHNIEKLQETYLSESSRKEEFQTLLGGNTLLAVSAHHQACERMGRNLEIVLEYEGIPKLFISRDNLFIGSQIHPEIYMRMEWLSPDSKAAAKGKQIYRFFLQNIYHFSMIRTQGLKEK